MEKKGFTDRQYRYVMSRVPALEWKTRREEFQSQVVSSVVQKTVDEAVEVNLHYVKVSNIARLKVMKRLSDPKPMTSRELLDSTTALERSQRIYYAAMGLPNGHSLVPKYEPVKGPVEYNGESKNKYTYEELKLLIEIKREQKKKAQDELKSLPEIRDPQAGDFTALPMIGYGRER